MSKLEPRIEAVREKYGLSIDDFWQIKQNKQWVCKHAALEVVAVKAGIEWMPPQIIEANAPALVTSMIVTGKMGDRVEWATGETNTTNYSVVGKQPAYPWAMSEKRAKDRVVLKLVGIHGLVYSEDEIHGEPAKEDAPAQPKTISAAENKRKLAEIDADLLDCHTIEAVKKCAAGWSHIADRDGWSEDYKMVARDKFNARKDELKQTVEEDIQDQFPGSRIVNEIYKEAAE